ncbi:hypothetical protein GPECTOR_49g550 [Gonium pectorale]|uniref:UDENN domain-containing protein n=1 Tax=Gonium pectorale TaxID=33097 RepID=A0A150G7X4_GONPE|nr:hypothetical protein GPECTOR_49g550 [Gonium pectorale]|eukprot:KXZ45966.1 hypothetical protein GPECTOR_49g550 [Gonium pectorale]
MSSGTVGNQEACASNVNGGGAGSPEANEGGQLKALTGEERFLYGFVFCRQRQDASLRRGGEQLSVVVLSEHPLSSALQPLAAVTGHTYFGAPGDAALRQVYDEVCRWPAPVAGHQLQLPVGYTALSARLPAWETLPHPSAITAQEQYGSNVALSMRGASSSRLNVASAASSRRSLLLDEQRASSIPLGSSLRNSSAGGLASQGAAQALSPRGEPATSPFTSTGGQQVPSRAASYAANVDDLFAAGTSNGGMRASGPVDVYTPLSGHLPRLWALWEMTLLGRAIMLVAPSPGETAAGVAALLALTAPLPYAPDFRPYYCIHDAAFSRMAAGQLPGPETRDVPTLIGVTNLYFVRALPHWPNVLSVGKREGAPAAMQPAPGSLAAAANMFSANAAVQALRQRTQGASVLLSGHTEALWASYKPLCRPDQALLGKLLVPKPGDVKSKVARIAFVNSDTIRRHFAELTAAFLSPFGRYFEADAEGRVPGWNSEEFLFGLRAGEVALPQQLLDRVGSPAAAVELYARFASCLNFAAWFAARRRHLAHLIAPQPRAGPRTNDGGKAGGGLRDGGGTSDPAGAAEGEGEGEEGGISSWFHSAAKHLDEVKVIGMYFSVEQQLMDAQAEAASPDAPDEAQATVSRLQRELTLLFFGGAMPEELQLTCVSSPARRELLTSLPLSASQAARVQQLIEMLQGGGK